MTFQCIFDMARRKVTVFAEEMPPYVKSVEIAARIWLRNTRNKWAYPAPLRFKTTDGRATVSNLFFHVKHLNNLAREDSGQLHIMVSYERLVPMLDEEALSVTTRTVRRTCDAAVQATDDDLNTDELFAALAGIISASDLATLHGLGQKITGLGDLVRGRELQLAECDDTQACPVCLERKKDQPLICGHVFCEPCANKLTKCALCRRTAKKLATKIYL